MPLDLGAPADRITALAGAVTDDQLDRPTPCGDQDVATVVGAGVTVFEALKAYDQLKSEGINIRVIDAYSVQPIDAETMLQAANDTGGTIITVEDHYATGGLGDAVSEAVAEAGFAVRRLAVREIPRSGQPDELIDRYGISARHIANAVRLATSPAR